MTTGRQYCPFGTLSTWRKTVWKPLLGALAYDNAHAAPQTARADRARTTSAVRY